MKDWLLTEQTGEQRDQRNADQRHTAAGHELLDALGLCAGVVIAVTFHQIDAAPDREAGTEGDHEGLEDADCGVKKCHEKYSRDKPTLFGPRAFPATFQK